MIQISTSNLYVIVVTYNGMQWIDKCLSCLEGIENIIIVDNNSTDGTVKFIQEKFPLIQVFEQQQNLGFGKANNVGIHFALERGAEQVFLLNQDAYIKTQCLLSLVNFQKDNKSYGILSPVHLNGKGDQLEKDFSSFVYRDVDPQFMLKEKEESIYQVKFVNAAGWLLSKECLETVGGFDPIFYHYGEDDNYCQRVRFHGFKIGVVIGCFLRHDRNQKRENHITRGSTEYFTKKERILKIKYANLNLDNINELKVLIKSFRKRKFKSYFKMDKNEITYNTTYLDMLKRVHKQSIESRKFNKRPGAHYLN